MRLERSSDTPFQGRGWATGDSAYEAEAGSGYTSRTEGFPFDAEAGFGHSESVDNRCQRPEVKYG
jgi:hypothetical protein